MRPILTALLLFLSSLLFGQGTIEGYVRDLTTGEPLGAVEIKVYRDKEVARLHTDSCGFYSVTGLDTGTYEIYGRLPMGKNSNGRQVWESDFKSNIALGPGAKVEVNLQLLIFCKYDATKDLEFCPKCKRKDKVRLQVYGGPPLSEADMIKALSDDGTYYYNGYCMKERCHAEKWCLRCKLDF